MYKNDKFDNVETELLYSRQRKNKKNPLIIVQQQIKDKRKKAHVL